jgi:predicted metal-dependent phosphoesterase TrpH
MLARLRADLHLHTREAEPSIAYSARDIIVRAARLGYRVVSITNHDAITYNADLAAFARDHDVLLIPGVEATVEGRHVLVYNADVEADKLRTFADLRRYRTPEWLIAAPHPLFPASYCLREKLWQEIDLFDAIEFSHFYTPRVDFNRPAVKLAAAVDLPLLGTSDSHLDEQFGTTFSLIEADLSVESVLAAVKHGRLAIVSRPLRLTHCLSIVLRQALANAKLAVRTRLRPMPPAGQTVLTPR